MDPLQMAKCAALYGEFDKEAGMPKKMFRIQQQFMADPLAAAKTMSPRHISRTDGSPEQLQALMRDRTLNGLARANGGSAGLYGTQPYKPLNNHFLDERRRAETGDARLDLGQQRGPVSINHSEMMRARNNSPIAWPAPQAGAQKTPVPAVSQGEELLADAGMPISAHGPDVNAGATPAPASTPVTDIDLNAPHWSEVKARVAPAVTPPRASPPVQHASHPVDAALNSMKVRRGPINPTLGDQVFADIGNAHPAKQGPTLLSYTSAQDGSTPSAQTVSPSPPQPPVDAQLVETPAAGAPPVMPGHVATPYAGTAPVTPPASSAASQVTPAQGWSPFTQGLAGGVAGTLGVQGLQNYFTPEEPKISPEMQTRLNQLANRNRYGF